MELIDIGRELWARRLLVVAGFIVAVAIGGMISYSVSLGLPPHLQSRQHLEGQAAAQVLIDTPTSQIADLKPTDPSLIYTRATLLADLMASGPVQGAIASGVGIPASELKVTPPPSSLVVPIKTTPLAVAGTKAGTAKGNWRLAITIDPVLPIIAFSSVAPTPQKAEALVTQAITVLRQHTSDIAASQHIPANQQVVVNLIGPPAAAPLAVGPRKLYGVAAAAVIFALICCAIVAASGVFKRRAAAREPVTDWSSDERAVAPVPVDEPAEAAHEEEPQTATINGRRRARAWVGVRSESESRIA